MDKVPQIASHPWGRRVREDQHAECPAALPQFVCISGLRRSWVRSLSGRVTALSTRCLNHKTELPPLDKVSIHCKLHWFWRDRAESYWLLAVASPHCFSAVWQLYVCKVQNALFKEVNESPPNSGSIKNSSSCKHAEGTEIKLLVQSAVTFWPWFS